MFSLKALAFLVIAFACSSKLAQLESTDFLTNDDLDIFRRPQDKDELISVQVVFSTGIRNPNEIIPGSLDEKSFPEGFGGLSNAGKNQMFKFGKAMARRYKDFFDDILVRNIKAKSSPVRRSLATSQAVLAGMFPPTRDQVWSSGFGWPEMFLAQNWQPISVATSHFNMSWKANTAAPCPRADKIEKLVDEHHPVISKFLADNADFMAKVKQLTGAELPDWRSFASLYTNLKMEKFCKGKRFSRPSWLAQVGPDSVQRLKQFRHLFYDTLGELPKELMTLKAGPLMAELVKNMKQAAGQPVITSDNKVVQTYGTHRTMISYLTSLLGVYQGVPTFGDGLLVEVRRNRAIREPRVHIFAVNAKDNNKFSINQLDLSRSQRFADVCRNGPSCSLVDFEAPIRDYLVDDDGAGCNA